MRTLGEHEPCQSRKGTDADHRQLVFECRFPLGAPSREQGRCMGLVQPLRDMGAGRPSEDRFGEEPALQPLESQTTLPQGLRKPTHLSRHMDTGPSGPAPSNRQPSPDRRPAPGMGARAAPHGGDEGMTAGVKAETYRHSESRRGITTLSGAPRTPHPQYYLHLEPCRFSHQRGLFIFGA